MQKICPFSYCVFCSFQWGGNSGPVAGNSGPRKFRPKHRNIRPYFSIRGFWLSLFRVSLWRGSGNLLRKFPQKFPGVRKFWSLVRNIRPPEVPACTPEYPALFFLLGFLAKSFSHFSLEGFRKFAPEVSSEISGGPEIPVLGPEYPA